MAWAAGLAAAACGAVVYRGLWRVSIRRVPVRSYIWLLYSCLKDLTIGLDRLCSCVQVKKLDNFESQLKM
jgi:hypothetical protein